MVINKEVIKLCADNYISLEELVYLYTVFLNEDWEVQLSVASLTKIKRLGLIDDVDLTEAGLFLIASATSGAEHRPAVVERFEEFWTSYPTDDAVLGHQLSRKIKGSKQTAKKAYEAAVQMGATEESIIKGLKNQLDFLLSLPNRYTVNPLKFFKAPKRWLEEKEWEDFQGKEQIKQIIHHGAGLV